MKFSFIIQIQGICCTHSHSKESYLFYIQYMLHFCMCRRHSLYVYCEKKNEVEEKCFATIGKHYFAQSMHNHRVCWFCATLYLTTLYYKSKFKKKGILLWYWFFLIFRSLCSVFCLNRITISSSFSSIRVPGWVYCMENTEETCLFGLLLS